MIENEHLQAILRDFEEISSNFKPQNAKFSTISLIFMSFLIQTLRLSKLSANNTNNGEDIAFPNFLGWEKHYFWPE